MERSLSPRAVLNISMLNPPPKGPNTYLMLNTFEFQVLEPSKGLEALGLGSKCRRDGQLEWARTGLIKDKACASLGV